MNARLDIPTECRAEFIADHRARVARTIGDLQAIERLVRAGLDTLQQHQQRAYRDDVTAVLGELNYSLGTHSGCPAIYWNPCAESELAELLMSLGADLQKHLPRKLSSIWASVRLDVTRCVLWFDLQPEPACPLEAA